MVKMQYYPKHDKATTDYKLAYDLVHSIQVGANESLTPANIVAFRKYLYDLAAKLSIDLTTRKTGKTLTIYRLK